MVRPKRTITAALVALLVLSGLGNAHGVVLCLGTDGHVGIKFSQETRCSRSPAADRVATGPVGQQLAGPPVSSSHCGHCIDIPLGGGDPATHQNVVVKDSSHSVRASSAGVSGFSFSSAEALAWHCAPKAQRVADQSRASLRTVVLLI